jgi:peptidoglycan/LPS O-acetylase OafA/YrhL
VLYHYTSGFHGGFIGVDIFFVISGYLITGILAKSFANRTYSLSSFYQRRIRRIFPALLLVLLLCLLVGWFLIFTDDYASLGKHIAAGAGFVQNLSLWSEAGYFDKSAVYKPLLQLWSLAVEEQFYIFWPLILWMIMRRRWPLIASITLIAAASFILNIWFVLNGNASHSFYFPTTRAWELMAGAWLAIGHRHHLPFLKKMANAQSWMGLLLILIGFATIHPDYGFPGFWALLPTLGTVLLINAGADAAINRGWFSRRWMVWVGLISYPLYLWHWVLLSLVYVIFDKLVPHWLWETTKVGLFALSILLSWITYRWLEVPIRKHPSSKVAVLLALLVALLGVAGFAVYHAKGFPDRPLNHGVAKYLASTSLSPKESECFNLRHNGELDTNWYCTLGDAKATRWIMATGDSHAMSMIPALDQYGKDMHIRVVFAGTNACLALLDILVIDPKEGKETACSQIPRKAADLIQENAASAIIFIERWGYFVGGTTRPNEITTLHSLIRNELPGGKPLTGIAAFKQSLSLTLQHYQSLKIPVLLVEDNPQQVAENLPLAKLHFDNSDKSLNANAVSLKEHLRDQAKANHILESTAKNFSFVSLLNTDKALCNDKICPWVIDGQFMYYNDDHLSWAGAMRVYPLLAAKLNQILKLPGKQQK